MMYKKCFPYGLPRSMTDTFLIGFGLEHMWILLLWEIIFLPPHILDLFFLSFFFFSFLFQEDLMESSSDEDESGLQDEKKSGSVVDMEDLGNIINIAKKAKVRPYPLTDRQHF